MQHLAIEGNLFDPIVWTLAARFASQRSTRLTVRRLRVLLDLNGWILDRPQTSGLTRAMDSAKDPSSHSRR